MVAISRIRRALSPQAFSPTQLSKKILLPLIAGAVFLLNAAVANADLLSPESGGSPNADRIDSLYWIIFTMGIVVFVAVMGVLIYTLIRYRESRGHEAAQIRGNTKLEIGWTAAATVLAVTISVITLIELDGIKNPEPSGPNGYVEASDTDPAGTSGGGKPSGIKGRGGLNVEVNGQQYLWRYTYPNGSYSYEEMVVPVNTTVLLKIKATDVIHSWWIPKLGGKFDAVPGYTNHTWFKASKLGTYRGQCAELCGRNHANMIATVRVVSVEDFKHWLVQQKLNIDEATRLAQKAKPQFETQ